jgi:hypothetical protein
MEEVQIDESAKEQKERKQRPYFNKRTQQESCSYSECFTHQIAFILHSEVKVQEAKACFIHSKEHSLSESDQIETDHHLKTFQS